VAPKLYKKVYRLSIKREETYADRMSAAAVMLRQDKTDRQTPD